MLQTEQRLDPDRDGQVEARLGILEFGAGDLADAVEPVAERVGMDLQPARGRLLLTGLQVGLERLDEATAALPVVLVERSQVAAGELDQALVVDRSQQAGEPEL